MRTDAVTYPREVPATLIVRLANGEEWDATEADIERFAAPAVRKAYYRFMDGLAKALLDNGVDLGHKNDLSNSPLNALTHLAQTTVYFGWPADEHMSNDDLRRLAGLDHALRALFAVDTRPDLPVSERVDFPLLFDNSGWLEHTPLLPRAEHVAAAARLLEPDPQVSESETP